MLSMCIPCNSAGHCTSTKGIDKKKPSIALLYNWTLWYLRAATNESQKR